MATATRHSSPRPTAGCIATRASAGLRGQCKVPEPGSRSITLATVVQLTVPLVRVDKTSPRSRLLSIDITGHPFEYIAGQAVMMGPHGGAIRRPFSIACSPERAAETRMLELLIAMEGGSEDLPWAVVGALVDIEGPVGTFTFPATVDQPRLLFVAGGTGIAPVRAMLDHAFRVCPSEAMSLLYSTRRSDEFAFVDELRAYERAGRLELHQTVTRDDGTAWGGRRGRI